MRQNLIIKSLAVTTLCFTVSSAMAAPVVDGTFSTGEWTGVQNVTRDSFINGLNATNGFQRTTRYLTSDASNFYLAIVADTTFNTQVRTSDAGTPADLSDDVYGSPQNAFALKPGPFVNAYLYSSTGQARYAGGVGTYGDGDDLIVETSATGANVLYSLDGSTTGIWGATIGTLTPTSTIGNATILSNVTLGITAAIDSISGIYEIVVPRSLVDGDAYSSIRAGGQAWAYGNTFNNFAAVPEPATVGLLGVAAMGLLARRRRA